MYRVTATDFDSPAEMAPRERKRELAAGYVHIWRIRLDNIPGAIAAQWGRILDDDERERAAKYRTESARDRFVASHGAMRLILSEYTGVSPERIAYCEEGNRKPALAGPAMASRVRFNLTHSEGIALLAVAHGHDLGVDVERVRPLRDALGLAQRFFAPEEVTDLRSLSDPTEQEAAFFRCWTRKEAVLKATGGGLRFPLSAFAVTLLPEEVAAVRRDERPEATPSRWALHSFEPAPGYVAALAFAGELRPVRFRDWTASAAIGS